MEQKPWVVYLLQCSDGSFYCGVTNNLEKRVAAHMSGRGAKYTRSRKPIAVMGVSTQMTRSNALKLEYRVKQVPAARKLVELENGGNQMATDIKDELKSLKKEFKELSKKFDKMIKVVENSQKVKTVAPKTKTVKAKTAATIIKPKTVAKKKSVKKK